MERGMKLLFVFIALILCLALIPLVLIDLKIKVSENQFAVAIRNLESTDETLTIMANNRKKQIYPATWNASIKKLKIHITNATLLLKNNLIKSYDLSKKMRKSLIDKKSYLKAKVFIKSETFKQDNTHISRAKSKKV